MWGNWGCVQGIPVYFWLVLHLLYRVPIFCVAGRLVVYLHLCRSPFLHLNLFFDSEMPTSLISCLFCLGGLQPISIPLLGGCTIILFVCLEVDQVVQSVCFPFFLKVPMNGFYIICDNSFTVYVQIHLHINTYFCCFLLIRNCNV